MKPKWCLVLFAFVVPALVVSIGVDPASTGVFAQGNPAARRRVAAPERLPSGRRERDADADRRRRSRDLPPA